MSITVGPTSEHRRHFHLFDAKYYNFTSFKKNGFLVSVVELKHLESLLKSYLTSKGLKPQTLLNPLEILSWNKNFHCNINSLLAQKCIEIEKKPWKKRLEDWA